MKSVCLVLSFFVANAATDEDEAIETLRSVSKRGPAAAQAAVRQLSGQGAAVLTEILRGFDGADPIAANWLRSAFETTASGVLDGGEELPEQILTDFITERRHDGRARRLAYDWLQKSNAKAAAELVPGMLFDPVPEFRRDAVSLLVAEGQRQLDAGEREAARETFEKALSAAVHDDQVKAIVKPLKELGREVRLQRHFGFLADWSIVGPFDNKEGRGFAQEYPPEKRLDLKTALEGETGPVRWQKYSTDDSYGKVNIAKEIRNYKGSCMYATTVFQAKESGAVEFRLATPNAWKLWVNGKFVFGHDEYHRTPMSLTMDVYKVPVTLKKGENRILLKICQNEQEQDWAQRYEFCVRVCDASGVAIHPAADRRAASIR